MIVIVTTRVTEVVVEVLAEVAATPAVAAAEALVVVLAGVATKVLVVVAPVDPLLTAEALNVQVIPYLLVLMTVSFCQQAWVAWRSCLFWVLPLL
jgi:hypothetical protein